MSGEVDYVVIVHESPKELQKKLNQWRHEYYISLHGFHVSSAGDVSVVVTRQRKEGKA